MTTMQVRPALTADARVVAEIHVASWQVAYRGHLPDDHLDALSVETRCAGWVELIGTTDWPRTGLLLAEDDVGEVVGFCHVAPSRDDDAGSEVGEVTAIYLSPPRWRGGAGRLLLDAAVERLRAAGYTRATLWVLEGNDRARRFYEAMGWRPDGTTKIDGRGSDTLVDVRYVLEL